MPIVKTLGGAQAAAMQGPNKLMAEAVRLSFLKRGAVDPDRSALDITAILRVGGGDETNLAGGYATTWRTQLAAGKAELHIDASTYTGPRIETGDRVRALSRVHRPWFEVLRVDDRGETRLIIQLGEV